MHRLSGQDAGFLYLELPVQPMNSMVLAVLRPATGADGTTGPISLDEVRSHVARRLDLLPSFRWRVEQVPLGLHFPVYIEDRAFDLTGHIDQRRVRAPGGTAEVNELCAELAEESLDRRRPLWRLTLVDGLDGPDGRRQALLLRYQHCLADGTATLTTLDRLFSSDEALTDDAELRELRRSWRPDLPPTRSGLIGDAIRDAPDAIRKIPRLAVKTVRHVRLVTEHRLTAPVHAPKFLSDTPPCSLNDAFTLGRCFARNALPMSEVRRVKSIAQCRVNDVVLAVVAGSLRAYLRDRGDLPSKALLASVPVAFESRTGEQRQSGNHFSALTTSLATDVADPWERLLTIAAVSAQAKHELHLLGPELLAEWLEVIPPFIAKPGARMHHFRRRTKRDEADVNVVVSNVRGPSAPWSFGSAIVDEVYHQGPPSNGVGLNVLIFSYVDQLYLSVLSFRDAVDAPDDLAAGFRASLDELLAAADAHQNAVASPTNPVVFAPVPEPAVIGPIERDTGRPR